MWLDTNTILPQINFAYAKRSFLLAVAAEIFKMKFYKKSFCTIYVYIKKIKKQKMCAFVMEAAFIINQ